MPAIRRTESQAQTQKLILAAASELFRSEGYSATSIDRIAEKAGFSKGAFYSNFESKEAVLLAVLEIARPVFEELLQRIDRADPVEIVDLLVAWADDRSTNGNWILAILEHARSARQGSSVSVRLETILRDNWRRLGEALLARCPQIESTPETLGALLHEITYAPAMTIVATPTAGQLMRLAATALLSGKDSTSTALPLRQDVRRGSFQDRTIER